MPHRILILEDQPDDAALLVHTIKQAGLAADLRVVANQAEYCAGLDWCPDLVLSDFSLPGFDSLAALRMLRERSKDTPFVVITGTFEGGALQCLREGAADFLLKDNLDRLDQAVANAIEQRDLQVVAAAAATRQAFQARLLDAVGQAVMATDAAGVVTYWNHAAEVLYGWTAAEAVGQAASQIIPAATSLDQAAALVAAVTSGVSWTGEFVVERRDGTTFPALVSLTPIRDTVGQVAGVIGVSVDMTERKQAEANRAYLAAIVESTEEAIVGKTLDGTITSWNAGAQRLYGYTAKEIIGQRVSLLMPTDRKDELPTLLAQLALGVSFDHFETQRCTKSDKTIDVSLSLSPIRDQTGQIIGASSIARDITERKQAEGAERARQVADEANQAKSEFLSRMSHELRTPLNAILGFGQVLQLDSLPDDQRESVDYIVKAGRHLLDLINEVLDIAGIEAGRLTLSLEPVELHATVREVLDLMRPLAAERRVRLTTTCPDDAQEYVVADRQRLNQVLLNLLSNAVKYNRDDGSITVSCRREEDDRVVIAVVDTGPGIPVEKLERLFTPFDRLGAEATATEGTGLGLALSRRLMEAMHGRLEVETAAGIGSTFWIELPLSADPIATPCPAAGDDGDDITLPASRVPTRTVLYIEDNLSNLQVVRRVLTRRPAIKVLSAMQGRLGLELARHHRPDLILLDLHLPDLPGLEVLQSLRNDTRTQAIPVIVLTAEAGFGQRERLLAAGARAYLTKPLDVLRFLALVDDVLGDDHPEASGELVGAAAQRG